MGGPYVDALRISPRYTSSDWYALDRHSGADWVKATGIVKDRLDGRFLRYAGNCLRSPHSGFVVLSIDSLLLETLQQFREGVTNGHGKSELMVTRFLSGKRFQPDFHKSAREAYYTDIRCGLLHQAEAKRMWLIRRGETALLHESPDGQGYIIDVRMFHGAVRASMNDYLRELRRPQHEELRANLWTKMNHICSVRTERGAVYAADKGEKAAEAPSKSLRPTPRFARGG
jgi:hypothetical protein